MVGMELEPADLFGLLNAATLQPVDIVEAESITRLRYYDDHHVPKLFPVVVVLKAFPCSIGSANIHGRFCLFF
jgi:hypothetical protein